MRGAWRIAGTARYGARPTPAPRARRRRRSGGFGERSNPRVRAARGRRAVAPQCERVRDASAQQRARGIALRNAHANTRSYLLAVPPRSSARTPTKFNSESRRTRNCEFVCGLFLPVFSFPLARFKAEKIGGRWCSPPSRRLAPPRYAVPPPAPPPACGPLDSPAQPPVPLCHGRDHIARRAHAAGIQRERASGHAAGGKGGWWRGRALHRT